jgi:hypothetical protein
MTGPGSMLFVPADRRWRRRSGHRSTTVTETVYRKQLRPVIEVGSDVMDRIFPGEKHPDA